MSTAASGTAPPPVLRIAGLTVEFATGTGRLRAVDGIDLTLARGETLAVVGESGSGKSVTALSVMRLLPARVARIAAGRVELDGEDLVAKSDAEMRTLRGRRIAMIFQEPMSSLNPLMTVGSQIAEPLRIHLGLPAGAARARAAELMTRVGIPDAARRLDQYPHQFSGGMRQRVMIAIALACAPEVIIADEPTTALDVTIQAQILELLKRLTQESGIALVLITHNLGIVARYADRIAVMYAGRLAETGTAAEVFARPRHPYTMGLLRSVPRLDRARRDRLATIEGLPPNLARPPEGCRFAPRCPFRLPACAAAPALLPTDTGGMAACHRTAEIAAGRLAWAAEAAPPEPAARRSAPILTVEGLAKAFPVRLGMFGGRGAVRAVADVSFAIGRGETLGLVGESGCGKSTVGRLLLGLETPDAGTIRFEGTDLAKATGARRRDLRRRIQGVFQDPAASLNPRMTVGQTLDEPLAVHGLRRGAAARAARVAELLDQVGLRPETAARYPHQLSGGQRQRVGIARALAIEPDFIVCDEAVSALDVSIQGQIINLLEDLQARLGLTYLFIAHDLAVVRHISTRVAVMYLGRIVETADRDTLYAAPLHPYTRALLDAAPVPDPGVERARAPRVIAGDLPSPLAPPSGCAFRTRCPLAGPECAATVPPLVEKRPGHLAACLKV